MDGQKIESVHCPQCGNLANKSSTAITNEHTIECRICGYQKIETVKGTDTFKGYGSLVLNDTAVLFHEPIPFQKEQEILKSISENPNASFFKWTDEHGITVLKGELPEEISDEEELNLMNRKSEEEYYNSFQTYIADSDCKPYWLSHSG